MNFQGFSRNFSKISRNCECGIVTDGIDSTDHRSMGGFVHDGIADGRGVQQGQAHRRRS